MFPTSLLTSFLSYKFKRHVVKLYRIYNETFSQVICILTPFMSTWCIILQFIGGNLATFITGTKNLEKQELFIIANIES